jgi:hypothetical protein
MLNYKFSTPCYKDVNEIIYIRSMRARTDNIRDTLIFWFIGKPQGAL